MMSLFKRKVFFIFKPGFLRFVHFLLQYTNYKYILPIDIGQITFDNFTLFNLFIQFLLSYSVFFLTKIATFIVILPSSSSSLLLLYTNYYCYYS